MHRSLFSTWLIIILAGTCNCIVQRAYCQTLLIDSIINPASLQKLVGILASDSFQGRFTGTEQADLAAEFIAQEFNKAGAKPVAGNDGYFIPFIIRGNSERIGFNVMAALKGKSKPDEFIIFSAHYDHVGTLSTNPFYIPDNVPPRPGDTIFNGANDNASGTSAIINLARYFGHLKNNERTILFIAFSGEELGLLGSKQLATTLYPEDVKAVINVEMIGRGISKKKKRPYMTGSNLSDLKKIINKNLFESAPELYGKKFIKNDGFADENLFRRSDNFWFAQKGIPAHTIMASSPFDDYYHSTSDEITTLDFTLMSSLVKAIAIGCAGLIEGSETPSRINPTKIYSLQF